MSKKLIIGISVGAVLVAAAVLMVLIVRSRALTPEPSVEGGGAPVTTGGEGGFGGTSGGTIQGGPSSGGSSPGEGATAASPTAICGDGACSEGETLCKADCGSEEERFTGSVTAAEVTATSFKITWRTDSPSTGEIRYGKTASYELGTASSKTPATSHAVPVTGLSPGTIYYLSVRVTEEDGDIHEVKDLIYETSGALQ